MSDALAKKGGQTGVGALQLVEARWGSLEEFAHFVMVERPELLEADFEVVAEASGLPRGAVTWLFRSSREFGALLDWFVAGEAWSIPERRAAYSALVESASDGGVSVGERVRAMDYLDRKLGVAGRGASSGDGGGVNVAVQVVQEGDGSWSSDYRPLTFDAQGGSVGGGEGVESGEDLGVSRFELGGGGVEGGERSGGSEGPSGGSGSESGGN